MLAVLTVHNLKLSIYKRLLEETLISSNLNYSFNDFHIVGELERFYNKYGGIKMKATYILAFSLAAYQMIAGEFNLMLFAFGYTFFGMFFSILLNTIKESKKLEEAEKEE